LRDTQSPKILIRAGSRSVSRLVSRSQLQSSSTGHDTVARTHRIQLTADQPFFVQSIWISALLTPHECAGCVPLLRAKEEILWLAKLAKSIELATIIKWFCQMVLIWIEFHLSW